jgi:hypothetical protein
MGPKAGRDVEAQLQMHLRKSPISRTTGTGELADVMFTKLILALPFCISIHLVKNNGLVLLEFDKASIFNPYCGFRNMD